MTTIEELEAKLNEMSDELTVARQEIRDIEEDLRNQVETNESNLIDLDNNLNNTNVIAQQGLLKPKILSEMVDRNYYSEGNTMFTGTGDRSESIIVRFTEAFEREPFVIVTLNAIEASDGDLYIKVGVVPGSITTSQFEIGVATRKNSKIELIWLHWIAIEN